MVLAVVLTLVIALVTRPGRAAAIKSHRLRRVVPVLDGVCALALIAIPVLGAFVIVDYRSAGGGVASSRRANSRPQVEALALANTGPDATTTSEATTSPVCRNSADPACGPFRWDPAPGPNSPIEISITYNPTAPRIGQGVTVTVHARDADALIGDVTVTFGDENVVTIPPASIITCDKAQSGPWSLPTATPDDVIRTFRHSYTKAGDVTIAAYAASPELLSATCPPNPYASQATASRAIHISGG